MNTLEVLTTARGKIEKCWAQNSAAVLEDGTPTHVTDPHATHAIKLSKEIGKDPW